MLLDVLLNIVHIFQGYGCYAIIAGAPPVYAVTIVYVLLINGSCNVIPVK